ncbi:unnamed protein product, partial [Hapterophycus canaliculatus]
AVDGDQAETLLERPPVSPSTRGGCGGSISLVADVGTSQLLEEIDRRLARKCSVDTNGFATAVDAPAAVVALFHRKYVDANRSFADENAVAVHPSCTRGRDVHACYHRTIEAAIGSLGSRFTPQRASASHSMGGDDCTKQEEDEKGIRLLLLDVHGQCKFANKLLIGTCNGKTADLQKLNMPEKGFLWHLRRTLSAKDEARRDYGPDDCERGTGRDRRERKDRISEARNDRSGREKEGAKQNDAVGVLPLPGEDEVSGYTGGYTVRRHGILAQAAVAPAPPVSAAETAKGAGERKISDRVAVAVDAIQLEFGSRLRRTPEARAVAAEAVASAVFRHLQEQQQSAKSSSSG